MATQGTITDPQVQQMETQEAPPTPVTDPVAPTPGATPTVPTTTTQPIQEIDGVSFEDALQAAGVVRGDGVQTTAEIIAGGQIREQYGRNPYRPGSHAAQVYDQWKAQQAVTGTSTTSAWQQYLSNVQDPTSALDPQYAELHGVIQDRINNPQLPPGSEFNYTSQTVTASEMLDLAGKTLGDGSKVSADGLTLTSPEGQVLKSPSITELTGALPELQGILANVSQQALIQDVDADVSQRYLQAADEVSQQIKDFEYFEGSTVKEQLSMLQDDWVGLDGQYKVPFYAQGAVTAAKQQMAARGMGGSSMAAAAITQAGLNAMIPVAMQDAQFFQTLSVKKFDMETSVGLAKLSHIANLDMAQLNHRQQMAVDTANKFFQVDMSNVDNARLVAATNNANQVQALFTDAAAANVAENLRFQSQVEEDRFYSQLAYQASESSARLLLEAGMFNASVDNSRQEFNSRMRMEVERDNINYLRSINTANTAGINQQNMINSQNLLNISNAAFANWLTLERDQLSRIWQSSENQLDRANNYAIAEMTQDSALARQNDAQKHSIMSSIGGALFDIGKSWLDGGDSFPSDWDPTEGVATGAKNLLDIFED